VNADLDGTDSRWLLVEDGFTAALANTYETLFTTGNGYLGTRGSLEEGHEGALPGTFLRGVFDHHDSAVIDLVKAPDWLTLAVVVNGIKLDVTSVSVVRHRRILDMREGAVFRDTVFEDSEGRRTRFETVHFASSADQHLCCLQARITPENHMASITVHSGIDGRSYNLDRRPIYTEAPPDDPLDRHRSHGEESKARFSGEAPVGQVPVDRRPGTVFEDNLAVLVSLAGADVQRVRGEVDVFELQVADLADPEPHEREHVDDRTVARRLPHRLEEPMHLLFGEIPRQAFGPSGRFELVGDREPEVPFGRLAGTLEHVLPGAQQLHDGERQVGKPRRCRLLARDEKGAQCLSVRRRWQSLAQRAGQLHDPAPALRHPQYAA